jgi:hypothetical protein
MARTAVIAGTATATANVVSGAMGGGSKQAAAQQDAAQQQQMNELQAQQNQLAAQQQALAEQQAASDQASNEFDQQLVQIQKLSALKDQGIITEEEFQAKKAQILGI